MSNIPALGWAAPNSLFGTLRAWLLPPPTEGWPPLPAAPRATAARPPVHAYGSARVLAVDDNPVNLMLISALLESRGLVPSLAADGAEAVALACQQNFDLILMDLQMPVLNGLEATLAIRRFEASHARPAVPVLAYSSMCLGAGPLARHGLNGSLSKPCEDEELEACLVQWCPSYRSAPTVAGRAHALR